MSQELSEIEKTIQQYEDVISTFERATERLRASRKLAVDGNAENIDRLLELHERTLTSLRHVLGTAKAQLQTRELSDQSRVAGN